MAKDIFPWWNFANSNEVEIIIIIDITDYVSFASDYEKARERDRKNWQTPLSLTLSHYAIENWEEGAPAGKALVDSLSV